MKNIKRFLFVWTLAVVMLLSACGGGNKTEELSSIVSSNTGVLYLILALFGFSIITYALAQNEINKLKRELAQATE